MLHSIETKLAPSESEICSQAIKSGSWVFLSGQIPLLVESNTLLDGSIEEQTAQVFRNLENIAKASGGSLSDVVKLTIYLKNMANLAEFNREMVKHFQDPLPARAVISVAALPMNAELEVEAIMMIADPAWALAVT
ncbi:Enamine/imine deaminase [Marinomonas spartinae]|uniref:Enamine/imine deaminase n=1 Tax=Marinomonas spartinae TaxID=1792290 RepID=A0A1A8TTT3_9GAMM|nr:Rid family detoxifying hydrolase [Marinomonas spartinae]SBS29638.1 Enamine/imine deaminase [Marinomonas spartinae]SBS36905.1 Enamine/imine deaminase [Marinomonas spartinae]